MNIAYILFSPIHPSRPTIPQQRTVSLMSQTSLAHILAIHQDELLRFIFRKVNCPDLAQDIFQDTFIRYTNYPQKEQINNHKAFIFRIAANLAADYERRDRVRNKYICNSEPSPETIAQPEALQPEQILSTRDRLECLAQAVEKLPPKCRMVFLLRKVEELSQAEIAEQLGISRSMVEKHLRHALQVLQQIDDD